MESRNELQELYNELLELMPLNRMGIKGDNGQTLYGDIVDWCKDFGIDNEEINEIALILVGKYYTQKEMEYYKKRRK